MNITTNELVLSIVAVVVLLGLNAALVAAEFSLVKLRFTRFGTGQMKEAKQSPRIAAMLDDMSSTLKLLRLGITFCAIAIGFILSPIAHGLAFRYGLDGSAGLTVTVAICFILAVGLHYIVGELVPRTMALQYPVESLRSALLPIAVFRFLAWPLVVVLNFASRWILKLFRLDPTSDLNLLDVESQIRSLVSEGEELRGMAENIVNNALDLRKRVAYDIMIPRNQLRYFDLEDSNEKSFQIALETGHTRFPLCQGDLDHCVGIIHIKDVFRSGKKADELDLNAIKRPMLRFSMDEPLERALQVFLKRRQHFALLTDDFEGVVGAITLEDVLEEVVGEIQDEFDKEESPISLISENFYKVDGLTPLHELAEALEMELEAKEVSTFGGYLTYSLGRMPRAGETVVLGRLQVTIEAVDKRRILSCLVEALPEVPDEASDQEED